jgi:hypothetical protein
MRTAQVMRDVLVARWSELGDKIVKLAEEFPEHRYDFCPVAGIRSFADRLRHVGFWRTHVRKALRPEEVDGRGNEPPREADPTETRIVLVPPGSRGGE